VYKTASDLAQRRARQHWLADLQADGFVELSLEEQRETLVHRVKSIEARILLLPRRDPERAELGKLKIEIQAMITALRPKWQARKHGSWINHFVQVAKERMPKPQFEAFMNEAKRRTNPDVPIPDRTGVVQPNGGVNT
jgi:hypothetical protein